MLLLFFVLAFASFEESKSRERLPFKSVLDGLIYNLVPDCFSSCPILYDYVSSCKISDNKLETLFDGIKNALKDNSFTGYLQKAADSEMDILLLLQAELKISRFFEEVSKIQHILGAHLLKFSLMHPGLAWRIDETGFSSILRSSFNKSLQALVPSSLCSENFYSKVSTSLNDLKVSLVVLLSETRYVKSGEIFLKVFLEELLLLKNNEKSAKRLLQVYHELRMDNLSKHFKDLNEIMKTAIILHATPSCITASHTELIIKPHSEITFDELLAVFGCKNDVLPLDIEALRQTILTFVTPSELVELYLKRWTIVDYLTMICPIHKHPEMTAQGRKTPRHKKTLVCKCLGLVERKNGFAWLLFLARLEKRRALSAVLDEIHQLDAVKRIILDY